MKNTSKNSDVNKIVLSLNQIKINSINQELQKPDLTREKKQLMSEIFEIENENIKLTEPKPKEDFNNLSKKFQ